MNSWWWLPISILMIPFVIIVMSKAMSEADRRERMLPEWAKANQFTLLQSEYRRFFKGPYFWTANHCQEVYYVTVQDSDGRERKGWVCFGSWMWGILSDKVDVTWEK